MFLLLEHVVVAFDWGDVFVRFLLSLLFVCVCFLRGCCVCDLGVFVGCFYWVLLLGIVTGDVFGCVTSVGWFVVYL